MIELINLITLIRKRNTAINLHETRKDNNILIMSKNNPVYNTKKLNLAILTDWYWPCKGGVERAAQSLATSLQKSFSVTVITHRVSDNSSLYSTYTSNKRQLLKDPDGNRISLLEPSIAGRILLAPLMIWNMPGVPRTATLYDSLYRFYRAAFSKRLRKLISHTRIVHCFSTGYLARCASEVCKSSDLPLVHSPFIHFGRWGDSPAQLDAYCRAGVILCPTEFFREKLILSMNGKTLPQIRVIPPITPEPVQPLLEKKPVNGRFVLFLGRHEPHKGLGILLESFRDLRQKVKLVIAGPSGEKHFHLPENAVDLREVDENTKKWLLFNCDLLCVPSRDETFGIVYTEAMSYGKPVVAFDIPPVNEIVQNGISGILVETGNRRELSSALEKLLSNETTRRSMGRAARDRFNSYFSPAKIIKEHLKVYNRLIG